MALPIPTTLDEKQINEFKALHKKYFNIDITDKQALGEGVRLMQFVILIIEFNERFNKTNL